ncbi:MAG: L-rhamnose mutarotase [Ferruginibacter sp.]
MKRYCLACDLKDDEVLIQEYETYHKAVWPEILESITGAGVEVMDIYRVGNRLFMIMEVNDEFSFEKKAQSDASNPVVVKWEQMLWKYQQALPVAKNGEKWMLMEQIFGLDK